MNKIGYIQSLKVFSAFCVVILHIISVCILFDSADMADSTHFASTVIKVCNRFTVPVFVMITGFLLLQPSKEVSIKKLPGKYVWRIVVILLTVGTAYTWLEIVFDNGAFSLSQFPLALQNVIIGKIWAHMWYLYMLIGLYLVLPLLKAFTRYAGKKEVDYLLSVLIIFTFIIPQVRQYTGLRLGIIFPIGSVYLTYMLLGYRIGTYGFHKSKNTFSCSLACAVATILLITAILCKFCVDDQWARANLQYDSLLIAILACAVFVCFKESRPLFRNRTIIDMLARNSFGIYIFHPLWINLIVKKFHIMPLAYGWGSFAIMTIVVFLLAWATTLGFRRLPYIGKYI